MLRPHLSPIRPSLGLAVLTLLLLASTACSTQTVRFVNPQSGATAQCSASGFSIGAAWVEETLRGCARPYESRGYVRLEKLTPEQRADLERRGLLPK
jgi:hypothetical protein